MDIYFMQEQYMQASVYQYQRREIEKVTLLVLLGIERP